MAGIVPNSFGSPLREFNKCHDATGKFCSGPRGLTGLRTTPPAATMHGRMDPAHAMNYDVTRAQQLGISVDVFAGAGTSGGARSLRNTVRVGYPQDRATPVETLDDEYKPSRASDLSVLRHEIGHVTDRGFGMRGDPSEARILGRTYPAWYLMEIGAWKAAPTSAGGYLPTCRTDPGTESVSAADTKWMTGLRSAMRFECAWMTTTTNESPSSRC
ncbi:MAG: hypothetical protein NTY02_15515 [Acidobacteria bacterium]|nr:hypothetical protein [Acidobacteriota bacterium]